MPTPSGESRGYDAGKKINGRERFIVTDTLGLLLTVVVLSAGMQGRDGAKPVLLDTYLRTPVRFVFADGGFAGRLLDWARTILARDYERDPTISEAMIRWAAINTITRRIARGGPATRHPPASTHLHHQ